MSRRSLVLVGLALVLGFVNYLVVGKEALLRDGSSMYLALAPVDPRSLIQGDYMRLDYALSQQLSGDLGDWPHDGRLVVKPDERGVAQFVRRDDGTPLAPGERYLRYRVRRGDLYLGADSFLFQEGLADRYEAARFAELKVTPGGDSLLVRLLDESLKPLP